MDSKNVIFPPHGAKDANGNGAQFAEWLLPFLHGCRRYGGRLGKMAKKPKSKWATLEWAAWWQAPIHKADWGLPSPMKILYKKKRHFHDAFFDILLTDARHQFWHKWHFSR
jgi:hypothetical protein